LESNIVNPDNVYLLLDVVRAFQPDVCYLWNLVAIGGAGIVATLEYLKLPWVWHLGDSVPAMLCNLEGQLVDMARMLSPRLSGRFLACSQTVVDTTARLVSLEGRLRIVPNWITHSGGRIDRKRDGRSLRLIHAGRLTEEKGTFILLDVVALLQQGGDDEILLELVGDGEVEDLRRRAAELGIQDRTRLRRADLFLFPTYAADPMPLAPLEAAAAGCVPVIPLLSGVSEWLVDRVNCIKAERTANGFAGAVRRVVEGEIELESLAARAARAVHEQFAIEKIMPTVESELMLAAGRPHTELKKVADAYVMALMTHGVIRRLIAERKTTDDHHSASLTFR
jgi:glycosyltransferase involved in cell wall biosynthesis